MLLLEFSFQWGPHHWLSYRCIRTDCRYYVSDHWRHSSLCYIWRMFNPYPTPDLRVLLYRAWRVQVILQRLQDREERLGIRQMMYDTIFLWSLVTLLLCLSYSYWIVRLNLFSHNATCHTFFKSPMRKSWAYFLAWNSDTRCQFCGVTFTSSKPSQFIGEDFYYGYNKAN